LLRRTVLLAVGLALALPSVAVASTVQFSPPVSCVQPGKEYPLAGTGFSPIKFISLSGDGVSQSFETNSAGAFGPSDVTALRPGDYDSLTPKTVSVSVTDPVQPAFNTSFSFMEATFGGSLPVNGKPNKVVTWQFTGFLNDAPIYGHYLYQRKEKKTVRFGSGQGPCGTLTKRAVRFPIKNPKNFGTWEIRVDSNPKWVRNSESLAEASFNVAKPRRRH
jgi:hypothetical protein